MRKRNVVIAFVLVVMGLCASLLLGNTDKTLVVRVEWVTPPMAVTKAVRADVSAATPEFVEKKFHWFHRGEQWREAPQDSLPLFGRSREPQQQYPSAPTTPPPPRYYPLEPRLVDPRNFYANVSCSSIHPRWSPRSSFWPSRIIHAILFNGEVDLLEIKLYELYPVVDLFVVVESPFDFRGKTKRLHFSRTDARWAPYVDKIETFVVWFNPQMAGANQWHAESETRRQVNAKLNNVSRVGDIIIATDVDELPRREAVWLLRTCNVPSAHRPLRIWMSHMYFHLGCAVPNEPWAVFALWVEPGSFGFKRLQDLTLRGATRERFHEVFGLADAGWHMSWMFRTVQEYQHKLSTFSHVEFDKPFYKNATRIKQIVCRGRENLFDHEIGTERASRTCTTRYRNHSLEMPHYLLDHPDKMRYLRPNRCELEKFE